MTRYLLDTNHLSPLVTQHHPLRQVVAQRVVAGDRFGIAPPALSEFLFGIALLPRASENRAAWSAMAAGFDYYHIDRYDAEAAAEMRLQLRRIGRQLALIDSFLAVVALRYNLVLLTTDRDFEAVPGLVIESWW